MKNCNNKFNIPVYLNSKVFIDNTIDHVNIASYGRKFYSRYIDSIYGISIVIVIK